MSLFAPHRIDARKSEKLSPPRRQLSLKCFAGGKPGSDIGRIDRLKPSLKWWNRATRTSSQAKLTGSLLNPRYTLSVTSSGRVKVGWPHFAAEHSAQQRVVGCQFRDAYMRTPPNSFNLCWLWVWPLVIPKFRCPHHRQYWFAAQRNPLLNGNLGAKPRVHITVRQGAPC